LSKESSRPDVESIDPPVAEVSHQQRTAEFAEAGWRNRHAPGRVQRSAADESLRQNAARIEDIDEPVSIPRYIVVLVCVLLGGGTSGLTVPAMLNGA
jgi:hypothetical protein